MPLLFYQCCTFFLQVDDFGLELDHVADLKVTGVIPDVLSHVAMVRVVRGVLREREIRETVVMLGDVSALKNQYKRYGIA